MLYTLYPNTLYPITYTLYPLPSTLFPIPYTLYPIPYTLYPTPLPIVRKIRYSAFVAPHCTKSRSFRTMRTHFVTLAAALLIVNSEYYISNTLMGVAYEVRPSVDLFIYCGPSF